MSEDDISSSAVAALASERLQAELSPPARRRAISVLTGIPLPTLKDYASGRTSPPLDRFLQIAAAAGRDPTWFLTAQTTTISSQTQVQGSSGGGTVLVPVVDAQAAAGYGRFPDEARKVAEFPFPREFILRLGGEPNRVSALRSVGNSMEPTIADGALMLMDQSKVEADIPRPEKRTRKTPPRRPPLDRIYVFFQSGGLRVKRLRWLDERYMAAISDNFAEHPPEIFDPGGPEHVKVLGRLIWWDNRL